MPLEPDAASAAMKLPQLALDVMFALGVTLLLGPIVKLVVIPALESPLPPPPAVGDAPAVLRAQFAGQLTRRPTANGVTALASEKLRFDFEYSMSETVAADAKVSEVKLDIKRGSGNYLRSAGPGRDVMLWDAPASFAAAALPGTGAPCFMVSLGFGDGLSFAGRMTWTQGELAFSGKVLKPNADEAEEIGAFSTSGSIVEAHVAPIEQRAQGLGGVWGQADEAGVRLMSARGRLIVTALSVCTVAVLSVGLLLMLRSRHAGAKQPAVAAESAKKEK